MLKFKKFISITIGSLILMVLLNFIFDHRLTKAAPAVFISTPATTSPTALQNFSFTIGTTTPLTLFGSTTLAIYGSTTIQTWRNTTHAFEVFDSATSTVFRVDTLNRLASTSALTISNLLSCDTIDTNVNGVLTCGTDATGAGGAYPFTPQTIGGTEHSASTTRPFYFSQGLLTSSSTIGILVAGSITATDTLTVTGLRGFISNASSTFSANLQVQNLFASTSLQLPQGANPTVDAVAELAFDTTSGFLISATSSADTAVVYARPVKRLYSFSIASTTLDAGGFKSGLVMPFPPDSDAYIVYYVHCNVWGGTSIVINLTDASGANDTNTATCDTATSTERIITTNNSWTAGEGMSMETGTITGTPNRLNVSVFGTITRD